MMKSSRLSLLLPVLLLGLASCHSGNTMDTLVGQSDITKTILDIYGRIFWWTVLLFIGVQGILIYAVLRFRTRDDGVGVPEQIHGHQTLEIAWTVLPTVILVHITVPTVEFIFDSQGPATEDAIIVNATGKQWWFQFEYPELGVVTANELHVPLGREVDIRLQSDNVIHALWAPQVFAKRDMMPGRVNHIKFTADKIGTFMGQCAEYCGDSHALMKFSTFVETPENFEKWVAQQAAPVAEQQATGEGFAAFQGAGCVACHTIRGTTAAGTLAPDLTHVGSRTEIASGILTNNAENLAIWLRDPPAVKPGSKMLNLNLKEDQITTLVSYLQSLK